MKLASASASRKSRLESVIRRRRTDIGLSQEKLAENVDCHRNYIGKVERGEQNLTAEMLLRFSDTLKCEATELLGNKQL